jgi:hypothetical protein
MRSNGSRCVSGPSGVLVCACFAWRSQTVALFLPEVRLSHEDAEAPVNAPVIVLGMHRSGTSLVARLLEGLGVFMGRRKDIHHEAIFFKMLNRLILEQAGATWDRPEPIADLLGDEEALSVIRTALKEQIRGPRILSYLGIRWYARYRDVRSFPMPWGWKDPCNVFTLPVWRAIFPDSRLVVVRRDIEPVVRSLIRRRQASLAWWDRRPYWRRLVHQTIGYRGRPIDSVRAGTEAGARVLALTYQKQLEKIDADEKPSESVVVIYERLVSDPVGTIQRMAKTLGIDADQGTVARLAATVRRSPGGRTAVG